MTIYCFEFWVGVINSQFDLTLTYLIKKIYNFIIKFTDDECNIIINELVPLSQIEDRYTTGMIVRIQESTHGLQMIPKLREVTRAYPGRRKLQLLIELSDGTAVTLDSQSQGVEINNELRNRIDDLLGGGHIQMITSPPKVQNRPSYAR